MSRFLARFIFGCLIALLVLTTMIVLRILCAWPVFAGVYTIPEGKSLLFVGDSHIGCSIDNLSDGPYNVVWSSSSAPWHTLMRVKAMARSGTLGRVQYCVTELGYQTFYGCCQADALVNNLKIGFPLYWRGLLEHFRLIP